MLRLFEMKSPAALRGTLSRNLKVILENIEKCWSSLNIWLECNGITPLSGWLRRQPPKQVSGSHASIQRSELTDLR